MVKGRKYPNTRGKNRKKLGEKCGQDHIELGKCILSVIIIFSHRRTDRSDPWIKRKRKFQVVTQRPKKDAEGAIW